jgi:hypothetical protein
MAAFRLIKERNSSFSNGGADSGQIYMLMPSLFNHNDCQSNSNIRGDALRKCESNSDIRANGGMYGNQSTSTSNRGSAPTTPATKMSSLLLSSTFCLSWKSGWSSTLSKLATSTNIYIRKTAQTQAKEYGTGRDENWYW